MNKRLAFHDKNRPPGGTGVGGVPWQFLCQERDAADRESSGEEGGRRDAGQERSPEGGGEAHGVGGYGQARGPEAGRSGGTSPGPGSAAAGGPDARRPKMVAIDFQLPKPMFVGTPTEMKVENLEKPLGKARPPFLAPEGDGEPGQGQARQVQR